MMASHPEQIETLDCNASWLNNLDIMNTRHPFRHPTALPYQLLSHTGTDLLENQTCMLTIDKPTPTFERHDTTRCNKSLQHFGKIIHQRLASAFQAGMAARATDANVA